MSLSKIIATADPLIINFAEKISHALAPTLIVEKFAHVNLGEGALFPFPPEITSIIFDCCNPSDLIMLARASKAAAKCVVNYYEPLVLSNITKKTGDSDLVVSLVIGHRKYSLIISDNLLSIHNLKFQKLAKMIIEGRLGAKIKMKNLSTGNSEEISIFSFYCAKYEFEICPYCHRIAKIAYDIKSYKRRHRVYAYWQDCPDCSNYGSTTFTIYNGGEPLDLYPLENPWLDYADVTPRDYLQSVHSLMVDNISNSLVVEYLHEQLAELYNIRPGDQ